MYKFLLVLFTLMFTSVTNELKAQVNLSKQAFGTKKLSKSPKRVYIKSFNVNYEVYKEAIDVKIGGSGFRGTETGDATARAAVGLSGIKKEDIQAKTDLLYKEFIADFKSRGYSIVSNEEASKIAAFEGWNVATGPFVGESSIPGVFLSTPSGHSSMYKKEDKKGKQKKGAFGGALKTPIISKQLGNALVVDVNLAVFFSHEPGGGFNLGSLNKVAKVKIKTGLRMVGDYAVTAPKTPTKIGPFGSVGIKGAVSLDRIRSAVSMTYGKGAGLSSLASYNATLKKPIEIPGVMENQTISAYQKQQTKTPTSFNSYAGLMTIENRFSKNTTWINVDSKKYTDGLYNACSQFLKANIKEMLD